MNRIPKADVEVYVDKPELETYMFSRAMSTGLPLSRTNVGTAKLSPGRRLDHPSAGGSRETF